MAYKSSSGKLARLSASTVTPMPGAPLLTLDHVDVDLGGVNVLRGVTWQLVRGEHWGVVGANGSGKSTLLGLIAGTSWPAPERGTATRRRGRRVE
jgi:ABC-type molybdenum transport system ATPase subunit/photorepair protein PhrA